MNLQLRLGHNPDMLGDKFQKDQFVIQSRRTKVII